MNLSNAEWWSRHGYDIHKIQPVLDLVEKRRREIMNAVDTHHFIPRGAKGHIVGSDHKRNKGETVRHKHISHHDLFGEKLPHEQVDHVVDFNEKVWGKEARDLFRQVSGEVTRLLGRERLYVGKCWEERNGVLVPNRFSMTPKPHVYSSHD